MKTLNLSIIFLIVLFASSGLMAQEAEKKSIELIDLQNLLGKWNGTLTYIDYSSNKPFSMPSELEIKSKRIDRKLTLSYKYPNEPKANNKSKLRISKNRSLLNGKSIVSRTKTKDGDIKIVTEYPGKDGNENKNAIIRNIYIIGSNKFIIRKEVQFEGSKDWIKRNEYNFKKK